MAKNHRSTLGYPSESVPHAEQIHYQRQMLQIAIREAFLLLPAGELATLWLTAVAEFDQNEAAEILGVPPGTVRRRLSMAHRRLDKVTA